MTTAGGFRLATSVGGVLTGRGADFIIIDDPLKPVRRDVREPPRRRQRMVRRNALFAPERQDERGDRHRHAAAARRRSRRPCHEAGRLGRALVPGDRRARRDSSHRVDPFGPKEFRPRGRRGACMPSANRWRRSGGSARRSANSISPASISRRPRRPAAAWSRRRGSALSRRDQRPPEFDRIVQSWDTANKPTELADYSVCTTWGLKGPDF